MDAITRHHYDNIRNNNIVRNGDGSISTVRTVIVNDGEREYLIPTVWDGEVLSDQDAFDRAMASDVEWPSAPAGDQGVSQLQRLDDAIHEGFSDLTTPQQAEDIVLRGADYPNQGIVGTYISPRPQPRPVTELSPTDIERIERVVWGEARGESREGRDAIRGVILNRLASGRFGDTLDDVLTGDQFNTINDHGNGRIEDIPVPADEMDMQLNEAADYYQLRRDASGGRTFYQNEETAKDRYEGIDPMQIGNHTYYRGLMGQEPVDDVNFSHNIRFVPDRPIQMAQMRKGGLALDQSEALKGITTQAGYEMAQNKPQLDRSRADQNGDGQVSAAEEVAETARRTVGKDDIAEMNCGGMMMPEMEIDPVSGNEVPLGATPENVRDDIPAMLSQDEYVLPAHVVKWHGLKHIQQMQMEAEAGLMAMSFEGLLGGTEYEHEEGSEEDVIEDIAEGEVLDGDDMMEDEYVEAMDVEMEFPAVEVEDDLEGEAYEEEPETSELPGTVKKQRYAFIVS